jgi:nitrite reductase/ring-hydroxylating ferredoxin subunit/uncharacterized membrane protein
MSDRDQRIPDTITEAVEAQSWLDPIAESVQPIVQSALDAVGLHTRNLLHGTVLGHPLHPAITDIPLGAWTVALALDLADAAGMEETRGSADAAVAIGLAGAAASAVAGLADWAHTTDKARRVGTAHAITNITATLLYTTSMVLRGTRSRQAARITALAGYGLAMAGAFLGGHLVFGQQVGVNHDVVEEQKPKEWTRVGLDDVQAKPKRVEADGVPIMVVRHEGELCALTETCPHFGGPLSEGKIVDGTIRCPWHGSRFDLANGVAVEGPTAFPARCFDVRVGESGIEVRAKRT